MSNLGLAETVTLQAAKETTPGTLAAAGWKEFQVNPGGIGNWKPDVDLVQRKPLSKRRQIEGGSAVNLKSAPTVQHDLTKDLVDFFADGMLLAAGKHSGNTGLSVFKPTAVSSTVYTVAALGALTAGFLVRGRNFTVAGNNGVKLVTAGSTGTTIPVAGLAAETVSGYTALVEVCGWRGTAGDIGIDVNGNITSTVADFTTMGLNVGQEGFLGGDLGTAIENFATAAYRGVFKIKAITAHLITLERRAWTVGAADAGAAKTISIWFGRFWRNVPSNHADSLTAEAVQPNYSLEAQLPGVAAAAATSYWYQTGEMLNQTEIDAPAVGKVGVTLSFVGRDAPAPTTTQATGSATSEAPIATALFNTVDHVTYLRVGNTSDESALIVDIDSWKLMLKQNISPQNQQGTFGAKRMIVGKCEAKLTLKGYVVQDDALKAVRDVRFAWFGSMLRNADGAMFFDLPNVQLDDGTPDFPENGPVTISVGLDASREASTYNTTIGISTFPYAPAA
jgi:Phage tail tube protein